jgi:hypothetical protein
MVLAPAVPAFAEYYDRGSLWPAESLARLETLQPQIDRYRSGLPASR